MALLPTESKATSDREPATIRVVDASKRYGATLAVDRVSFEVRNGEIAGFLGPNGAGKSTLLKMMCTWLRPTSGRIEIAGHDVVRAPLAVRRSLGYLPEHNALWETMYVSDFLRFVGRARRLPPERLAARTAWVVDACGLGDVLAKRIRTCSKGYRQRIGVAAALLHDPPVILLDEPTHGLDPLQVAAFLEFLGRLAPGRAILFSSHVLSEVVAVSRRLLVIQRGRLVADASVAELRGRAAEEGRSLEEHLLALVRAAGAPPEGPSGEPA
jgi:ABC-2 type transport system ATP-binding protein